MSPRGAALIAVLGVLLVALLVVVALLAGRAATGGAAPTSAATSVGQASQTPVATAAATPTATPTAATPTSGPPTPAGQTILTFSIPQTVKCEAANQGTPLIHLSWTTANATGVTISIDGPGKYADYPATGSADVPFACGVAQHTYLITTHGSGSPATRTVVVRRTT